MLQPVVATSYSIMMAADFLRHVVAPAAQVDMTWSGHSHVYHRSAPVLKGKRAHPPGDVRAPVHITMGNAGYQVRMGMPNHPWT
jgi:hypothetical protein